MDDSALKVFDTYLNEEQRRLVAGLTGAARVQEFLDETPYSADKFNRCPLHVLQDRRANCFDGALLAAAALRRLGHPPLLVNLFPEADTDDDHVLAIYRHGSSWGAVAKSNMVGIRFREAVYRTLRELVMSYFEPYFNVYGQKTLRSYTRPLDLRRFDKAGWMWHDSGLESIIQGLDSMQRIPILAPEMTAELSSVDKRSQEAGLLGSNPAGLFWPAEPGQRE